MIKLIAALVAVVAAGIGGAILVPRADAQPVITEEETAEHQPAQARTFTLKEILKRGLVQTDGAHDPLAQARATTAFLAPLGQTGTWQIVSHDKLALLLNTASGETFVLREEEGKLKWQPIPRPHPEMHGFRMMPVPERAPRAVQPPSPPRGEGDRFAEMSKHLDQVEKELAEIQRTLKEAGPGEKEKLREKRRELEKRLDELEAGLRKQGR